MDTEKVKSSIIWEKVRFERTKENMGNRQTFALEVSIAKDENYLAAFDFVKATVNHESGVDCEDLEDKRKRLKEDISRLEYKKNQIGEEIKSANEFRRRVVGWMNKVGLNYKEIITDDIPF
ncbi:MAG: hypothetical protein WBF90_38740 [Rivularia sp. (in: cyanobacteria)]